MHTREQIIASLHEVAEAFGSPARETILYENEGKHITETELILERALADHPIVDVGGGLGVNLLCLRKLLGPEARLVLLDRFAEYDSANRMGDKSRGMELLEAARIEIIKQDFWQNQQLPFAPGSVGIVTFFDVVEHLPGSPLGVLEQIRRALRPGGAIVMSGPNAVAFMRRADLLLGRHPYMPFELWMSPHYYAHYREYRRDEYLRILERAGFSVERSMMKAEPTRSRARHNYHNRKRSPISGVSAALWIVYLIEAILPAFRSTFYAVAAPKPAS
jgi:SAM-dependent methyltransferase